MLSLLISWIRVLEELETLIVVRKEQVSDGVASMTIKDKDRGYESIFI
jgi:hypothetical protein